MRRACGAALTLSILVSTSEAVPTKCLGECVACIPSKRGEGERCATRRVMSADMRVRGTINEGEGWGARLDRRRCVMREAEGARPFIELSARELTKCT